MFNNTSEMAITSLKCDNQFLTPQFNKNNGTQIF